MSSLTYHADKLSDLCQIPRDDILDAVADLQNALDVDHAHGGPRTHTLGHATDIRLSELRGTSIQ